MVVLSNGSPNGVGNPQGRFIQDKFSSDDTTFRQLPKPKSLRFSTKQYRQATNGNNTRGGKPNYMGGFGQDCSGFGDKLC